MYDVFNTVKRRGGHLNISLISTWKNGKQSIWPMDYPTKFFRRRNFNGLKLTGVFTVR